MHRTAGQPNRLAISLAAVALVAGTAAPLHATMVKRVPLESITREASRVVHATVAEVRSGRDESGLPATWITLDVARTLKGRSTVRMTIKQYGVAEPLPDGTITRVAGLPRYAVGEEIVLFLRGESRRGFTSPVGLGQGAYRVSRAHGRPSVRSDVTPQQARDLDEFVATVERLAAPSR